MSPRTAEQLEAQLELKERELAEAHTLLGQAARLLLGAQAQINAQQLQLDAVDIAGQLAEEMAR